MKNFILIFLTAGVLLSASRLHSQMPVDNPTPASIMAAMKATNAETLAKQAATLQALDQLAQDANQIKIFSKRG